MPQPHRWHRSFPLLFLIFSSACGPEDPAQSLNPFFTPDAVVQLPELEGNWLPFASDGEFQLSQKPWHLGANVLRVSGLQGLGDLDSIPAVFFRSGETLFMDLYPEGELEEDLWNQAEMAESIVREIWWSMHLRRMHVVYRARKFEDDNVILLEPLDEAWVLETFREDPNLGTVDPVAHMFTRTSEEWMAFLRENAAVEEAFTSSNWNLVLVRFGHEIVFETSDEDEPMVFVSPESKEFPNGIETLENTMTRTFEDGQVQACTLARDWPSPLGFTVPAESFIFFFADGRIGDCALAENWTTPDGLVLRADSRVQFFKNGRISHGWLAEDWRSPSGFTARANTEVIYYEDGYLFRATLRDAWRAPDGTLFKAGHVIHNPDLPADSNQPRHYGGQRR